MTPVVGIALLVAITLLLAATVAAFALGIGDEAQSDPVPTLAVGFEYEATAGADDVLTISHRSGETVAASEVEIVIEGASCSAAGNPDGRYSLADPGFSVPSSVSAGMSVDIGASPPVDCGGPGSNLDLRSATVRVVWAGDSGTTTSVGTWTGPG